MKNQAGKRREENSDGSIISKAPAKNNSSSLRTRREVRAEPIPTGDGTPALLSIHFYTHTHVYEHKRCRSCCVAQASSLKVAFYRQETASEFLYNISVPAAFPALTTKKPNDAKEGT